MVKFIDHVCKYSAICNATRHVGTEFAEQREPNLLVGMGRRTKMQYLKYHYAPFRRAVICMVLIVIAGCAATPQVVQKPIEIPVFPPPPEQARFIYERSIYSSADAIRDDGKSDFRRMVTGEKKVGEGLAKPYGIAVRQGRVYVTDTVKRVVMVFDFPQGTYHELGAQAEAGLRLPLGIDVDAAGNVYVSDGITRRISVYGPDGKYLRQLGSPDTLKRPVGIALDAAGALLYVVDIGGIESLDHGVHVFDVKTGAHLRGMGKRGDGPGEFNLPRDVAVGKDGNLYIRRWR
jgi:hypothetical protein